MKNDTFHMSKIQFSMKTFMTTLIILCYSIPAFSCICGRPSFCQYYKQTSDDETTLIFKGSYLNNEEQVSMGSKAIQFRVEKIYEGQVVTENSIYYSGEKYVNTDSTIWLLSGSGGSCLKHLDNSTAIFIVTYNSGWPPANVNVGYVPTYCATDYFPISVNNEVTGWIWEIGEEVTLELEEFETVIEQRCGISSTDESNFNQINIYPNPVDNILTIEYPYSSTKKKAALYDSQGNFIKSVEGTIIDLTNTDPGIYFVKIRTENAIIIERVIKI